LSFQLGQLSLGLLLCLTGFYRNLEEDRPWRSAAWLALGTCKPQLVLFPFVILLGLRRWRALAAAVCLLAVWAALTTAVLGWPPWPAFVALTRLNALRFGSFGIDPLEMYNLKGLLTAVLGTGRAALVNAL